MIGSLRVCLSRNWRAITLVSNNTAVQFQLFVIGHLRHLHVNYVHSNLYCVQKVWNIPLTFSIKKEFLKDFLTSKFVIDTIN